MTRANSALGILLEILSFPGQLILAFVVVNLQMVLRLYLRSFHDNQLFADYVTLLHRVVRGQLAALQNLVVEFDFQNSPSRPD